MKRIAFLLLLTGAAGIGFSQTARAGDDDKVDFNRDIRPILSESCFTCHGPDETQRKAKLRLDTREGAFADRDGSPVLVAGDLKKSHLFDRLVSKDEFEVMPPPKSGKKLKKEQIELVKRWIEEGAVWEDHWSFVSPKRPALPAVKNKAWAVNPIDHFVLARLEREGLTPSKEADRITLIRRVTLDLTGLPATPEEVRDFVNDAAPNAYEKLVDRLLASPRYGEHKARFWLDAARYGDTHGLHLDNYREMFPYRDWVIGAFNRNLPYDQFVIEQLAGDLLPNHTLDQLVATGFNRNHVSTNEGGSIADEVFVRNVVDRVDTTGTVFMGLTLGCAVCHEHKYDPISQKEFYQIYAYFNSIDGNPLDGNAAQWPPIARVPSPEQKEQLATYQDQIAQLEKEIRAKVASIKYTEPAQPKQTALPEPKDFVWIDDDLPEGAKAQGSWKWITEENGPVLSGKKASTETVPELSQHFFTGAKGALTIAKGDKFFAHVYLDPKNLPKAIMLQWNDGTWEHRAYWGENVIPFGNGNTPGHRKIGKLPRAGEWVRLEVDAALVGLNAGAKINGWAFTQFGGTVHWDKAGVWQVPDPSKLDFDSLVQWEEFYKKRKFDGLPDPIKAILNTETDKRTDPQKKELTEYFVEHVFVGTRPLVQPLRGKLAQIQKQMTDLDKKVPTTLVWKEKPQPVPAKLLIRGDYDQPGDVVPRAIPAVLPPMAKDLPNDRLGFAKWLVSPEHPLTARVAINRTWQEFFGTGIVRTSEDFGNQGERPSHPLLLDWLAVEFRESGWDNKHMQKLIAMSATYRQESKVSAALYKRDPENRLLARGPRIRLDAEMVRDQALFLSGLLVEKVGGPSVKPPQPADLWFAVGYSGSNTVRFVKDSGPEKVYRRSLYTFWKRTSPPIQMDIFDAPSREACKVRRERTNTPLQALMLMNDPQFVEAARAFGQRIMKQSGTVEDRIRYAFELATARQPTDMERGLLTRAFHSFLQTYKANPKAAEALIRVGESPPDISLEPSELAAWTMIGNTILNLDEVIMKN
jgi:hypothetical protein